ncbi:hypothetical protein GF352_02770 [archaeon]|nr:hypothetical protein [archaeon]
MKITAEHQGSNLIISSDNTTNSTLSNQEILEKAIENVNDETKKIIILSRHVKKEYSAEMLKGLKELGTKNPVKDYLNGRKELKKSLIIKKAGKHLKKEPSPSIIYNKIFKPRVVPRFVSAKITYEKPKGAKKIKEYTINESKVTILEKNNQFFYHLKPAELNCEYETIKKVSETLKEIEEMELSLNNFKKDVTKLINKKQLTEQAKNIIKRHSTGFGVLDIIFNDPGVQDAYLYSSNNNLHLTHSIHGDCGTNIKVSKKDLEAIATKIRVASGRPFDGSFPVVDYELDDYNLRICGVREPLTFKGIGYAFRKHRKKPWTLPDFIENGMISSSVAGLLNFLIDSQCSILITGPRGSGKTSLLSALLNEVPKSQRVIVIEDTPELPVNALSKAGFRIQHLRIKPPLKERTTSYELSAEEALRTALRLGESVLVIGEVRGEEARALFEAMRVGATGNVVLGTIHGSNAYDTFDRVVNDLKVPATSFKATDIILSCANLRRGESLITDKRLTNITEIKKDWANNPFEEKGFNELTIFNRKNKTLKLSPKIKESNTLKKIARLKGISINDCLKSIKLRAKAKELIVKTKAPRNPGLIAEYNNKITELISQDKKNFLPMLRKFLKGSV